MFEKSPPVKMSNVVFGFRNDYNMILIHKRVHYTEK